MEDRYDFICKIVLVGESSVGKTGLIRRFTKDTFTTASNTTIGIELAHKTVQIRNKTVKAQLWDTGGQEKFRCITAPFYRGALGGIIVYDVTNRSTFQSVSYWIEEIQQKAQSGVAIVIVGNKSDIEEQRQISAEEGKQFAESCSLPWFETSAKSGVNVEQAFEVLMDNIYCSNLLNTSTTSLKLDKSYSSSRDARKKKKSWC